MNAGFEDVSLLDAALSRTSDFAEAFDAFWRARKPDADAIAALALENFVEMRDKVADPEFLRQRALEAEVQKRMGGAYLSRYQLVTFTRAPYRVALQAGAVQQRVLSEEHDVTRAEARMRGELLPLLRAHALGA
jgi:kynurenine 3-monooxygenase